MLTVSPSPHIHTELTVPKIMQIVIIALMPALIVSVYTFGLSALYLTIVAVMACMFFEYIISRYLLERPSTLKDGSAVITGILVAFNVPSNLPWYILVIGCLIAIGIGKMSFGGLGNNPFNPALVGRVFLLLSFPVQMTSWPTPGFHWTLDATTSATPLGIIKDGLRTGEQIPDLMKSIPSYSDFFLGIQGGSMGEVSAVALLVGFVFMMYKKVITWHIPVTLVLTIFVMTGIFWLINPDKFANPLFHILTGGVLLGAIFMATDYVTSPVTHTGMIVFAIGIGVITVLIRLFGSYPEGISFAILIMNGFAPMINRYVKPIRFGNVK
jgi:Na+-translocating ferredoxin:NAD+ oxidoreductase subunit D